MIPGQWQVAGSQSGAEDQVSRVYQVPKKTTKSVTKKDNEKRSQKKKPQGRESKIKITAAAGKWCGRVKRVTLH